MGAAATAISAKAPKGTKFTFGLSEPATAVIAIDKLSPGRKVGKKCVRKTRRNRKRHKCTRVTRMGTLTRAGLPAGTASVPFSGRLGSKKLRPGAYRAMVVAADMAGNTSVKPPRVKFRIVRR